MSSAFLFFIFIFLFFKSICRGIIHLLWDDAQLYSFRTSTVQHDPQLVTQCMKVQAKTSENNIKLLVSLFIQVHHFKISDMLTNVISVPGGGLLNIIS